MSSPPDDDELHRAAILARRSRFVALALMGTTSAVSATACACLTPYLPPDAGSQDSGPDGGPGDAATSDAASSDAAASDAASSDAASSDAEAADSGGDGDGSDGGGTP